MEWLKRWNFIERARLERELLEAFGRGEDLDALVAASEPGFQQEMRQAMLVRIRKMERMMADQKPPESSQSQG